jgi:hypothetical protein
MKYVKTKWNACQIDDRFGDCDGTICYWYDQWDESGATNPPNGPIMINLNNIWDKQNKSGTRWRTDGLKASHAAEKSKTA